MREPCNFEAPKAGRYQKRVRNHVCLRVPRVATNQKAAPRPYLRSFKSMERSKRLHNPFRLGVPRVARNQKKKKKSDTTLGIWDYITLAALGSPE